jgi:lysyl-tRNA synthetase class 2
MTLTEELLSGLARDVAGSLRTPWGEKEIDWTPPFRRLTMRDAVLTFTKEDPRGALAPEDLADEARLLSAASRYGVEKPDRFRGQKGRLLAEVFEAVAEPHLIQPTFIREFPTEISPLSRQTPGDPEWADRFELYAGGMEIANAFSELTDPAEQAARFRKQADDRARGNLEAAPYDEDYVEALEYGLPPTAGEGLGIDRVTMLLTDRHSIRDVILFPLLRPRG